MPTFIERCTGKGDFDAEVGVGYGQIDLPQFKGAIDLYDNDEMDAESVIAAFNCSEAQGVEIMEILATKPGPSKSEFKRAQWAQKVVAVMYGGLANASAGWTGFETASACRVKLGLSA